MKDMLVYTAKLQLSVLTKSGTHFVKTSAKFLKAINTDFELKLNNLFPTVHNKWPRQSKVRNISQHSKESIWRNMEKLKRSIQLPSKTFGGRQTYIHEKSIFPPFFWGEEGGGIFVFSFPRSPKNSSHKNFQSKKFTPLATE